MSIYFYYFIITSLLERTRPFIWINLNSLHPGILCAKFVWNWPSGSGEDYKMLSIYFHYFRITSLSKGRGPSFELTWIPFTQGYFVPSLSEIGPGVLEKKIIKSCQFFFIPNNLPFGKGVTLHLNNFESPSPRDTFLRVWLKLSQCFWRRRWTDGQTDGQTDDRWSEKLTWAFISDKLKLKYLISIYIKSSNWFGMIWIQSISNVLNT